MRFLLNEDMGTVDFLLDDYLTRMAHTAGTDTSVYFEQCILMWIYHNFLDGCTMGVRESKSDTFLIKEKLNSRYS